MNYKFSIPSEEEKSKFSVHAWYKHQEAILKIEIENGKDNYFILTNVDKNNQLFIDCDKFENDNSWSSWSGSISDGIHQFLTDDKKYIESALSTSKAHFIYALFIKWVVETYPQLVLTFDLNQIKETSLIPVDTTKQPEQFALFTKDYPKELITIFKCAGSYSISDKAYVQFLMSKYSAICLTEIVKASNIESSLAIEKLKWLEQEIEKNDNKLNDLYEQLQNNNDESVYEQLEKTRTRAGYLNIAKFLFRGIEIWTIPIDFTDSFEDTIKEEVLTMNK